MINDSQNNASTGNDTLNGGAGNDDLLALLGDDTLNGGAGFDRLVGGLGNDTLNGGADDDSADYRTATGPVTVNLGSGSPQNTVSAGTDRLVSIEDVFGTAYGDTLTGNAAANYLFGGGGNDVLTGGAGNDDLDGFDGNDTLSGSSGADFMQGGTGNDVFFVEDLGDTVVDSAGLDTVNSTVTFTLDTGLENLTLTGANPVNGTGNTLNNLIYGNGAANVLTGLDGNDTLNGAGGNDTLVGGIGNDLLNGGTGNDAMTGGVGNDTYTVDSTTDTITELLNEGRDVVASSATFTLPDHVENMTLTGALAINATGNGLANAIGGNTGNNILTGGAGNDTISGGNGNDTLLGGLGLDTLTGGGGVDGFVFLEIDVGKRDTLVDFTHGSDTITLDSAAFTGFTGHGQLAANQFVLGLAATTPDHRVIYDQPNGRLSYDPDGNGAAAQVLIAKLANNTVVDHLDMFY